MPLAVSPETDEPLGEAITESTEGHVEAGLGRLIERWKGKPNLEAFLRSYLEQCQELEEAIWFVIFGRMPDYADFDQLNHLGKLVGRARDGLPDDLYRLFIKAQIRVNQSFGTATDLIEIVRLVDSALFRLFEYPTASMLIAFLEPLASGYAGQAIPKMLKAGRAIGVSLLVTQPTDAARGALYGSVYAPSLNVARGWSSFYDNSVGGLYGHATRA